MTETLALLIPILGTIGTFTSTIILIYLFFSSRHKERMALIERDKDASIFSVSHKERHGALKVGVVTIMIGLGILAGHLLSLGGLDEVVAYFSMILLFGGTGLILFYVYLQRKTGKEKQEEMV